MSILTSASRHKTRTADADPEHGIREIVVGTGGRSHDPLGFRDARTAKYGIQTPSGY